MNEIGGSATSYLPLLRKEDDGQAWAVAAASKLQALLALSPVDRLQLVEQGINHAAQFKADDAIAAYLKIYRQVLAGWTPDGIPK
jgi:hypothetical protein